VRWRLNPLFQKHERTGRPLGDDSFAKMLMGMAHRLLRQQKPGPRDKENNLVKLTAPGTPELLLRWGTADIF
jgi:hypothetical protein